MAVFAFSTLLLGSCETLDLASLANATSSGALSSTTIGKGLKEALAKGVSSAVATLSKDGGFHKNPEYKITIPKQLDDVSSTMRTLGMGSLVDIFEKKMNAAAEEASASAGPVFLDAIGEMSFDDAKKILYGNDTEATDYLKKHTSPKLKKLYAPIIEKNIRKVGVGKIYSDLMAKYDAIPLKSKPDFSLENYVLDKSLDAMFKAIAKEEKNIRANPAARTTDILKKVFAAAKKK
jgi:hypothetical protein